MKKSLVALAALAATGAFAQSSVTIYGAIDASYNRATQDGVSKSFLGSSQLGSSKLGFTGVEDLGGGLKANFKIEGGLNNDSGSGKATNTTNNVGGAIAAGGLTFQRYSYVGLSGGFGEFRLGRDYVGTFLTVQAALDPFGTNGPADSTQMMLKLNAAITNLAGATTANASNMVEYTTPKMAGFSANVQYWMGENNSNAVLGDAGNGAGINLNYGNGPISLNIGTSKTKAGPVTATNGDYTLTSLSGGYNFGAAQVIYTYARETAATTITQHNTSNQLGVIVPVGAMNIKGSYIASVRTNFGGAAVPDQKGTLLGLGVDYALSKRTTAYVTYAHVSNKNGGAAYNTGGIGSATPNNGSTNYAIGMKHNF